MMNQTHATVYGLRVLITEEDGLWTAQSLEIDYSAGGNSIEDVKNRFILGLSATIKMYFDRYQNIEKLIKPAPAEDWMEFMRISGKHKHHTQHVDMVSEESEYAQFFNEISFFQSRHTV